MNMTLQQVQGHSERSRTMTYVATITNKGQVTIPVAIRDILNLQPSSRLIFSIEEERIIAEPIKADLLSLYGSVKSNKKALNTKDIRKIVMKKITKDIAHEGF